MKNQRQIKLTLICHWFCISPVVLGGPLILGGPRQLPTLPVWTRRACLSMNDALIMDIKSIIPALLEEYHNADTLIIHVGAHDIYSGNSPSQIKSDMLDLCQLLDATNCQWALSGPIPNRFLTNSSEKLGQMLHLTEVMKGYATNKLPDPASGCGGAYLHKGHFLDNTNSFWTRRGTLNRWGLPTRLGTRTLGATYHDYFQD